MNSPTNQTHVSFKTDFGVEFGILTCFDIMFEKPLIDLHKLGIKDIIFPTAWVDGYPMFLGKNKEILDPRKKERKTIRFYAGLLP
jgi:predicted amidohydrolase